MFHVRLAEKMTGAKDDGSGIGREPASLTQIARSTQHVRNRHFATRQPEVLEHEHHTRAYVQSVTYSSQKTTEHMISLL